MTVAFFTLKTVAEHHIINWEEVTIIGQESDRTTRWITEAVIIQQPGRDVMNRDEGAFLLSHIYDISVTKYLIVQISYQFKSRSL